MKLTATVLLAAFATLVNAASLPLKRAGADTDLKYTPFKFADGWSFDKDTEVQSKRATAETDAVFLPGYNWRIQPEEETKEDIVFVNWREGIDGHAEAKEDTAHTERSRPEEDIVFVGWREDNNGLAEVKEDKAHTKRSRPEEDIVFVGWREENNISSETKEDKEDLVFVD